MSKLDLKAAMDSLQVKTPLKLQTKAPSFRVPAAPTSSTNALDPWVQNQSQDLKSSLDETRTLDVIQSKDQNVSQDSIESLDAKPSLDSNQPQDQILSKDLNSSLAQKSSVDANPSQDQVIPKDSNSPKDVNQSLVPNESMDLDQSLDMNTSQNENSTQGWDENSPYKKDKLETKKEKLSLSTQIQSEYFRKYFDEVKPRRKRETELQAFRGLKSDFSEADILIALEHVLKHGMPGSGEACHSPMAYLAKAIGQVLGIAKSGQEKLRQKQEREAAEIRVKEAQEAEEEREIQNALLREQDFQKAFSGESEQAEVIANFGRKFPMLAQRGPLLRNLAISAWWDDRQA